MAKISGKLATAVTVSCTTLGVQRQPCARYGSGEKLTLALNPTMFPHDVKVSELKWHIEFGKGHYNNELDDRPVKAESATTYTVPTPGSQNSNAKTFDVKLGLKNAQASLAVVILEVVCPQTISFKNLGDKHVKNLPNSGFWGQPLVGPADVSFMGIEIKESIAEDMMLDPADKTNPFWELRRVLHRPSKDWAKPHSVTKDGTLLKAVDDIWIKVDYKPPGGWKNVAYPMLGSLEWPIHWIYRPIDLTLKYQSGVEIPLCTVVQVATCLSDGSVTISKGMKDAKREGAMHDIDDPTENLGDTCPIQIE